MKNWYFSLKDSEGGVISEIKIQKRKKNNKKTEHSEIKQFGNNNNSVPKSKSILNKFEKGEVLRWSLRKKIQRHCTDLILLCGNSLENTQKIPFTKKKTKKTRTSYTGLSAVSTVLSWERVDMLITGNRLGTGP